MPWHCKNPSALRPSSIEHLWSNLAFKRAIIACAWPVAGQAGSPPAWMLPDGAAWTKAVYTMEILALLQAAKSDVSPHISLPTYLIGLGSGGTIAYQIAVAETRRAFGLACVWAQCVFPPCYRLRATKPHKSWFMADAMMWKLSNATFGTATRCVATIGCPR